MIVCRLFIESGGVFQINQKQKPIKKNTYRVLFECQFKCYLFVDKIRTVVSLNRLHLVNKKFRFNDWREIAFQN